MNFNDFLSNCTERQKSLVCAGIDPDVSRLPPHLSAGPEGILSFCSDIIESTRHAVAAYKINFAFFEIFGADGWRIIETLVRRIPQHIVKIADAKRGDIGNTSRKYAEAILLKMNFDCITVNPYMGSDSVEPFLQWPEKGAIILALTSNKGSRDLQYLESGPRPLYAHVIAKAKEWNVNKNCGVVVGATHPGQIAAVRESAPQLPFLIPGIGAQGGSLADAVLSGTDDHGRGALINASRSILYKSSGKDFAEAARLEAEKLRDDINEIRRVKWQPRTS
jgi:orotidine-5'-phosphate decarboxylase